MAAGWAAPQQCHKPRSWGPLGLRPGGCCDSLVYPVPSHPIPSLLFPRFALNSWLGCMQVGNFAWGGDVVTGILAGEEQPLGD